MMWKRARLHGAILFAAVCSLTLLACPGPEPPTVFQIADFAVRVDLYDGQSQCEGEKPANIGCTTLCKPCIVFICENGEWVREDLDMQDEEFCKPHLPGDKPPSACPRTSTGFCPAECSVCF